MKAGLMGTAVHETSHCLLEVLFLLPVSGARRNFALISLAKLFRTAHPYKGEAV